MEYSDLRVSAFRAIPRDAVMSDDAFSTAIDTRNHMCALRLMKFGYEPTEALADRLLAAPKNGSSAWHKIVSYASASQKSPG
jgi:hypothetical protein